MSNQMLDIVKLRINHNEIIFEESVDDLHVYASIQIF